MHRYINDEDATSVEQAVLLEEEEEEEEGYDEVGEGADVGGSASVIDQSLGSQQ